MKVVGEMEFSKSWGVRRSTSRENAFKRRRLGEVCPFQFIPHRRSYYSSARAWDRITAHIMPDDRFAVACGNGDLELVTILTLTQGIDVNTGVPLGQYVPKLIGNPLKRAISGGHLSIVKFLCEQGADKEAKDSGGQTALHSAVFYKHVHVVKYLCEHGADKDAINNDNKTPLHYAANHGHLAVAKYLCEQGANKEARDNLDRTPMFQAAFFDKLPMVMCLCELGAEKDALSKDGLTPMYAAAQEGHLSVVMYLCRQGVDKEITVGQSCTALLIVAQEGHLDIVKYLCEQGANKEARSDLGATPLLLAAYFGHLCVVKYLCEQGADKEARDNRDKTPLACAARKGHISVVMALVEHGARKFPRSLDGTTPLHSAVDEGNLGMVKYLCEQGANLEAKTKVSMVQKLGSWPAQQHPAKGLKDVGGQTPLHIAAYHGHLPVVKYLCKQGADMEARDSNGLSVQCWAGKMGRTAVSQYLSDALESRTSTIFAKMCGNCGKACTQACSLCHAEFYCDESCFKAAWKSHKKACVGYKKS